MADLIFKDIKVGFIPDTEVEINNKKYLIHDVINGETIKVDASKKYPELKEVIKKSPYRIDYKIDECGGCQFMHITYDYEQKLKTDYINDLFKGMYFNKIELIPMESPYNYRNKSQMTFKLSKTKKVVCGLYEEFSHNIITANNNILQAKKTNLVINELNKILTKNKIRPYDEKKREGELRHVYIRYGFNTDELMLVLVTNGEILHGRNNIVTDLKKANLGITTIVQNYNSRNTSIVLGDKDKVLMGPGFIYEACGDFKFKISPLSFFQVNTAGMKILYETAIKMGNLKKTDTVIDAYCGVGTISIFLSKHVKHVYGVEINKNAINDAKINQKINNINNVSFVCDDATNYMTKLAKLREHVDVVVMDPPRDGSTKQFINAIKYLNPRRVIYISCNPQTLKRDLYLFFENDYVIKNMKAVDMFPRTIHSEMVTILEKDDELELLENLVKENQKNNTKKYKENKIKYIPKADIEMMREDKYEANGFKKDKKRKY
ncbi:MAG: 23S rRNA (uracil(1939)-C(5))-methyltransferase RlmD [Acholeplasmatales bacterium]|nr:23S rRNA (uracil(1939)-C(5))-methyltransferase RlmD [Acholeplasmatales bacterium]